MSEFKRVIDVDEVPSGQAIVVTSAEKEIALFNLDGNFYAIENTCTHRGGPLGKGDVDESEQMVTCPWHQAKFDVTNGEVLGPPAPVGVESFPTRVEDGAVWVKV